MTQRSLLIIGPDSSLSEAYHIGLEAYPDCSVEKLSIPSTDYYHFDLSALSKFPPQEWDICIAVNEFYINDVRRALHEIVHPLGYKNRSLISPQAYIAPNALLGTNNIIYPGCYIGSDCVLGNHCVLKPNVVLSEKINIGNYVTLEANVSIREFSEIRNFTTICANSSLSRMTIVGSHCYLNLPNQYSGTIQDGTFYSPAFENPVTVITQPSI